MESELEFIVDCAGTAEWRKQKQLEFPDDTRNADAAELLLKLAVEVAGLNGSPLHERIEKAWEGGEDIDVSPTFSAIEIVNEELRAVGFGYFPTSGRELLDRIAVALESRR